MRKYPEVSPDYLFSNKPKDSPYDMIWRVFLWHTDHDWIIVDDDTFKINGTELHYDEIGSRVYVETRTNQWGIELDTKYGDMDLPLPNENLAKLIETLFYWIQYDRVG